MSSLGASLSLIGAQLILVGAQHGPGIFEAFAATQEGHPIMDLVTSVRGRVGVVVHSERRVTHGPVGGISAVTTKMAVAGKLSSGVVALIQGRRP